MIQWRRSGRLRWLQILNSLLRRHLRLHLRRLLLLQHLRVHRLLHPQQPQVRLFLHSHHHLSHATSLPLPPSPVKHQFLSPHLRRKQPRHLHPLLALAPSLNPVLLLVLALIRLRLVHLLSRPQFLDLFLQPLALALSRAALLLHLQLPLLLLLDLWFNLACTPARF